MTYIESGGALNSTHSLTHSLTVDLTRTFVALDRGLFFGPHCTYIFTAF